MEDQLQKTSTSDFKPDVNIIGFRNVVANVSFPKYFQNVGKYLLIVIFFVEFKSNKSPKFKKSFVKNLKPHFKFSGG